MAELEQFLATGLPAPQRFALRPDRDTVLTGAQGTQLLIAADAWDLPPGSGPVELRVQEFYQTADLVLAGLTTTAGPDLLETGGMVHLAASAGGQPVRLRPGAAIHLRMPAASRQDGMQLFLSSGPAPGQATGLDWQLPPPPGAAAGPQWSYKPAAPRLERGHGWRLGWWHGRYHRTPTHYSARYVEVPECPGGEARTLKALTRQIDYSAATKTRLRKVLRKGRRIGKKEFAELRSASVASGEHVIRLVHATFCIDTAGQIGNLAVQKGVDEALGQSVVAAVRRLGPWEAARMPRYPRLDSLVEVAAFGEITAYFTESGKVLVDDSVRWDRPATVAYRDSVQKQRDAQANARSRNYYISLTPRQQQALDSTIQAQLAAERARLVAKQARLYSSNKFEDSQAFFYNELSLQSLGWVNCDRFRNPGPRIEFVIREVPRNTVTTLVFRDIKSTIQATVLGSSTTFANMPTGEAATIVALRREQGITYLAKHEVRLGTSGFSGLTFRPVTIDELRAELSQ